MAQPRDYTRQYNFNDFQATNPDDPLPGNQIDAELNTVKLTLDDLNTNIAKIQRDDGKLGNASVHKDAFDQAALALINSDFTPRGDWVAAREYAVNDAVDFNGATYVATVGHTSSAAFATDDAADRWLLIANAAISGTGSAVDKFEGDGNTTAFTLSYNYTTETAVQVFVNGELLNPVDDYTISGTTLTLFTAPGLPVVAGNENVIVWGASVVAQAAAADASGHESNASGFADEAEAWASKTNGIVESTDYSSKAWSIGGTGVDTGDGSAKDWATKLGSTVGNTTEYSAKYWATQGDVPIVASNIADINTVAAQITPTNNVATLASISADISTLADIEDGTLATNAIQTVAGIHTAVSTVAADQTDIGVVSGISADVQTLADLQDGTVVTNGLSDLAAISGDIATVAADQADIGVVSSNIASVNTVATNINSVITVANDLTEAISEVETVANDLNEATSEIETVANAIANVDLVGTNITAVPNVSSISSAVVSVIAISTEVVAVYNNSANINAVEANETNINTLAGLNTEISALYNIRTNITSVDGNATNINAVAANQTNIDAVAAIDSDVTTVSGISSEVVQTAANFSGIADFADTYKVSATQPLNAIEGTLWFDTTNDIMKVYDGSAFQNAGSSVNGTVESKQYTVGTNSGTYTGSLTTFPATYDSGYIHVWLNGVKLYDGVDFTATDGANVVLNSAATNGDVVSIVAYGTFLLADHYSRTAVDALIDDVETLALAGL